MVKPSYGTDIMESPGASQLPEADSLPDGFVDSSTEALAPSTPTLEEKSLGDYKEEGLTELDESTHELGSKDLQTCKDRTERTQKLRTFPVPLSEMDNSDASVDTSSVERTEGSLVMPNSANPVSETSAGVSGCSEVKGQAQGECQNTERYMHINMIESVRACVFICYFISLIIKMVFLLDSLCIEFLTFMIAPLLFLSQPLMEDSSAHGTHVKGLSASESDDTLKNRKPETTETKRKNVKRGFKSEKEFLEFTLKYQKVLAERDGAIAVRDKLESLCRELQRQNKMLMEECKRVSTEGQNLRLDLSTKFQDAIKDVSIKLDEQKDECLTQLKENDMLRNNLKQLADQCALSEQQYAHQLKQKSLELQIADLKIKQHEEKLVQEQSQMKLYAEQVSELLATEKYLRLQLTADGEKFQQFQDALLKSNEVFETFKQEIEKMTKSIKELKKENVFLKSKCDKSDVTLIELVEERERLKKQLEKSKNQKEKLESLCRSLQAERKQNSMGSNNSDSVPV
ncbi:hypothetical protein Dsin_004266 [Dipteronia sinensis]|uniref:Beta-taxilin n=1 Tax=Dipteronia sinensis TaxID=43782 RepID=A0AAE0BAP2_9ROSI|nr:hypothetical protein Dsin_004266 [Dipteronia sinensis]